MASLQTDDSPCGDDRVQRTLAALRQVPVNDDRRVVYQTLLAADPGVWVANSVITAALIAAGRAKGTYARCKLAGVLKFLDWQVQAFLPPSDLPRPPVALLIDLRPRSVQRRHVRLTPLGRAVLTALLAPP